MFVSIFRVFIGSFRSGGYSAHFTLDAFGV